MPEVRNDGVRISYDVAGEGRPLVLPAPLVRRSIVGGPSRRYVDALRTDRRLVIVDLRGHGQRQPHEPLPTPPMP